MSVGSNVRPRLRRLVDRGLEAKVAFMHIPKCGGTSVDRAMRRAYGWPIFRHRVIERLNARSSLDAATVAGMELEAYRELLLLYALAKPNLRYVSGHFVLSERAFREFGDEWSFVTLLRHPVSRWFSHYFFNRYKVGDHFRIGQDIDGFVESERGRALGSFFVRKLTGAALADAPMDERVERAIANLDRFAVVGLLERLPQFARDFEHRFGDRLRIRRLNENPRTASQRREEVTDAIRERVERLCEPDLRVYERVLERVEAGA